MRVRFLKPVPDCRIWRCVPSPQSIRKRYSSCLTICAERPLFAEGAEAEVPRKSISNKVESFGDQKSVRRHCEACRLTLYQRHASQCRATFISKIIANLVAHSKLLFSLQFYPTQCHINDYLRRFSRLCRGIGPDLGVRACIRTLSPPNPGIYHGNSQRGSQKSMDRMGDKRKTD